MPSKSKYVMPVLPTPKAGPRLVGYARVSTDDQNMDMQLAALVNAGVHPDNIWSEQVSAVAKNRPSLEKAMADAREGDTLVVWKLDRFARSMEDLVTRMRRLQENGVAFKSLTEGFDTSTPVGKLLVHVLGALAQFERDLVVERTKAGVKAHRERGGRVGQPAKLVGAKREKAIEMIRAGKSVKQVASKLKVAAGTVYSSLSTPYIKRLRAGLE